MHLYDIKSNVYAIQARGIGVADGQGASPHPQTFSCSKITFLILNFHGVAYPTPPPDP